VHAFAGLHLHHFGNWLLPVRYVAPDRVPPPPDRAAYPSLAIAAIVRNEALGVENMLRSAAPVASFIAVLDTGSTDDTVARAENCLAATGVPFALVQREREAFDCDFSAMRNAALDMVPASIDWVLMVDADEELVPEDYTPLLELIGSATAEAFWLPRYNYVGPDKRGGVESYPDWQVRLMRNKTDRPVRYEGRVHERVLNTLAEKVPLDASAIGGARGGPHIHHLVRRFRSKAEEAEKQAFYLQIAQIK
jgi:glycosyltransferase involved in cell wall biosynthesis